MLALSSLLAVGLGCVEQEPPEAVACGPAELDWESYGDGYVRNWCRGCHSAQLQDDARSGAPIDVDFNTHADVLAQLDRVLARAATEPPSMPPAGGPPEEEARLFRQWLECGAP